MEFFGLMELRDVLGVQLLTGKKGRILRTTYVQLVFVLYQFSVKFNFCVDKAK
jgi:hypothetical protein